MHRTIIGQRACFPRLKTRENIDRYCEKFEKDMLHLFDRAYRRGDPKMMHVRSSSAPWQASSEEGSVQHCAQTLLDFNGGASCVQVYVNQHDFFINRVRADENIDNNLCAHFDRLPMYEEWLTNIVDGIACPTLTLHHRRQRAVYKTFSRRFEQQSDRKHRLYRRSSPTQHM